MPKNTHATIAGLNIEEVVPRLFFPESEDPQLELKKYIAAQLLGFIDEFKKRNNVDDAQLARSWMLHTESMTLDELKTHPEKLNCGFITTVVAGTGHRHDEVTKRLFDAHPKAVEILIDLNAAGWFTSQFNDKPLAPYTLLPLSHYLSHYNASVVSQHARYDAAQTLLQSVSDGQWAGKAVKIPRRIGG